MNELAEQFIPLYPERHDDTLTYDITGHREFSELKLESSENVPIGQGTPLISQSLQQRFFSPNTTFTEGLLFHGLGTGKTCTSSLIVENFKRTIVDGEKRRPALVIVPNDSLINSYRTQVLEKCTREFEYQPMLTKQELDSGITITKKSRERRLRKEVSRSYEIVTLERFIKTIKNIGNDPVIISRYSDRVIIIDEAHHLRIQPKGKNVVTRTMYDTIHGFLHTVQRCRKILLTGTPIWDKVEEIGSLMNLILPMDEQLPTGKKFAERYLKNGELINERELIEKIKGRVSYLRQMMTTAKRSNVGVRGAWTKYLTVYPDAMSDFQYDRYANAKKETDEADSLKLKERDSCTCVFPDGSYGGTGFRKNIKLDGKTWKYKDPGTKKMYKDDLQKYSAKFASILKIVEDNPNEVVFIYNSNVASGASSAINLGLILQAHGWKWAKSSKSLGEKTFCIITGKEGTINTPAKIQDIVRRINSKENRYGKLCRIIIGSRKIAEGITLKNVRQMHIASPHWNIPSLAQALGRGFRVGSHNNLPKDERKVDIYYHVSLKSGTKRVGEGFPKSKGFSNEKTVDVYMYNIAETKERNNTLIYRLLKTASWDCALTYERNVLKSDESGSRDCDYQDCNYRCDGYPQDKIDESGDVWKYEMKGDPLQITYNLYYSSKDIQYTMNEVKKVFKSYFALDFKMLKKLVLATSEPDEQRLLIACEHLINRREPISDRYGFDRYLKEDHDVYFLSDSFSRLVNYQSSVYVSAPLIAEKTALKDMSSERHLDRDIDIINAFCSNPQDADLIPNLSLESQIIVLESVWDKPQSTARTGVMKKLGKNVNIVGDIPTHRMHAISRSGVKYNLGKEVIKADGKTRIFVDGIWRYATPKEEKKLVKLLFEMRKKKEENVWKDNKYGVAGKITDTGNFKIMQENAKGSGQFCNTKRKADIISLFSKIGAEPSTEKADRAQLCAELLAALQEKDLMV